MAQLDDLLQTYKPWNDDEAAIVKQLQQFLAMTDNAYDRSNLVAHVVADAWIVNPSRTKVVLVEHVLNQIWLAPGGHCDGSTDVREAAIREAEEESGLQNLKPLLSGTILDIASGHVESRMRSGIWEPAHIHFDICFAFEANETDVLKISDESTGLKWVDVKTIKGLNYMPRHMRRVEKTLGGMLDD